MRLAQHSMALQQTGSFKAPREVNSKNLTYRPPKPKSILHLVNLRSASVSAGAGGAFNEFVSGSCGAPQVQHLARSSVGLLLVSAPARTDATQPERI